MSNINILPNSTLSTSRVVVRRGGMNWVTVYCANCGKEHGMVPEQSCTFTCFLCDPCSDKWGEQYGYALVPDVVFYQQLVDEQMEQFGRILSPQELDSFSRAKCNPLSTLIREIKS